MVLGPGVDQRLRQPAPRGGPAAAGAARRLVRSPRGAFKRQTSRSGSKGRAATGPIPNLPLVRFSNWRGPSRAHHEPIVSYPPSGEFFVQRMEEAQRASVDLLGGHRPAHWRRCWCVRHSLVRVPRTVAGSESRSMMLLRWGDAWGLPASGGPSRGNLRSGEAASVSHCPDRPGSFERAPPGA